MTNARKEFLEEVGSKEVLCVDLKYGYSWVDPDDERQAEIQLVAAYSQEEYDKF